MKNDQYISVVSSCEADINNLFLVPMILVPCFCWDTWVRLKKIMCITKVKSSLEKHVGRRTEVQDNLRTKTFSMSVFSYKWAKVKVLVMILEAGCNICCYKCDFKRTLILPVGLVHIPTHSSLASSDWPLLLHLIQIFLMIVKQYWLSVSWSLNTSVPGL